MERKSKATSVFSLVLTVALATWALSPSTGLAADRVYISIGTGTVGGTYYPLGGTMAKIWTDKIPNVRATVQSTGGTIQNIQLMADKQTEVGFTDTKYVLAYKGKGPFQGKPQAWLRGFIPLYPEPTNIVVAKGSGIKSLKDLKGKRVSIGAVGSGTEATSRELFNVLGMDADKDIKPFMLGMAETASAFQDKRIDAAILVGSLGASAVVEIMSLNLVDFIEVDDELFKTLYGVNDTWIQFTIPANYYQNQPKPVKTYAAFNTLSVRDDLPTDLAYQMTKTLFDNKKDLIAVRPTMENMNYENVQKITIPIHPGAIKYYKEVGAKLPN
jgi:uncharacterized protein